MSTSRIIHALSLLILCVSLGRGDVTYQKCVLNMSDYDDPDKVFYKVDHVFKGLHNDGIIGIIHRCTLGVDGADVDFVDCKKAAQRDNLLWGAYHFGKEGQDPIQQADLFVDTLSKGHTSQDEPVLMVLDEEFVRRKTGLPHFMPPRDAAAFIKRVYERTGVYPGLYTGRDFLKEQLNSDRMDEQKEAWDVLKHCWLWVAKYAAEPPESDPWETWSIWQYTGDGLGARISGLPETVPSLGLKQAELNIYSGTSNDARDFWVAHSWDYTLKAATTVRPAGASIMASTNRSGH